MRPIIKYLLDVDVISMCFNGVYEFLSIVFIDFFFAETFYGFL